MICLCCPVLNTESLLVCTQQILNCNTYQLWLERASSYTVGESIMHTTFRNSCTEAFIYIRIFFQQYKGPVQLLEKGIGRQSLGNNQELYVHFKNSFFLIHSLSQLLIGIWHFYIEATKNLTHQPNKTCALMQIHLISISSC